MLSAKGFGLTSGILWAVTIAWCVLLTLINKGTAPFDIISQLYLGWITPDMKGLIVGIVLGFIDGLIAGMIFAWLYNTLAKKKAA